MIELANEPSIRNGLTQLLDSSALKRVTRLQHLTSDALVRRYQSLWHRHGPRSGSPSAIAQGIASQQRGAAVEASAEEALNVLAHRLNQMEETPTRYRVVTSRSEEHTSELQSLMRNSYAVFCLKKKNKIN